MRVTINRLEGDMASGTTGQPNHPMLVVDRIKRRLSQDLSQLADPTTTFGAINSDIEELKASIQPWRQLDPMVGALSDLVQLLAALAGNLAGQLRSLREPGGDDVVSPTPEPAPVPEPAPAGGGSGPATPVLDPSRL